MIVAINVSSLSGWGGGLDFLRMIIYSLIVFGKDKNIKIYLLFPYSYSWDAAWKKNIKHVLNCILSDCGLTIKKWHFMSPDVTNILIDLELDLSIEFYLQGEYEKTLKKIKADVVCPVGTSSSLWVPQIPFVGYIFDFQHKYFPHFFSVKDYIAREQSFAFLLLNAPSLIVHSLQVKKDIERFYPTCSCQVFGLPFVTIPLQKVKVRTMLDELLPKVKVQYDLPEKYFVMCNQFWVHKDHMTAFKALAHLSDQNIHIVCTGKTQDYRVPKYFDEIQKNIEILGVQKRIHFLGYVPKEDQLSVMYNALALIQPTLFDGSPGGLATSEAVALGIPVILSDIPVNKLVNGSNISFFAAGCAEDLATKMRSILENPIHRLSHELLFEQGLQRAENFGSCLYEALSIAIKK